jgi:hypothetical protein
MSNTNTGGPAFPGPYASENGNIEVLWKQHGMTLRDYFAAHANPALYKPLEILTEKLGRSPSVKELADYIASVRFVEADAMLKAREA